MIDNQTQSAKGAKYELQIILFTSLLPDYLVLWFCWYIINADDTVVMLMNTWKR